MKMFTSNHESNDKSIRCESQRLPSFLVTSNLAPLPRPLLQPMAKQASHPLTQNGSSNGHDTWRLSSPYSTLNHSGSRYSTYSKKDDCPPCSGKQKESRQNHHHHRGGDEEDEGDDEEEDGEDDEGYDRPRASSNDSAPHDSTTTTQLATSSDSSCSSLLDHNQTHHHRHVSLQSSGRDHRPVHLSPSKSIPTTTILPTPTHLFLPIDTIKRQRIEPPSPGTAVHSSGESARASTTITTNTDPAVTLTDPYHCKSSHALSPLNALLSTKANLHFQPPAVRPQYYPHSDASSLPSAASSLLLDWQQLTYDLSCPSGLLYRISRVLNLNDFDAGAFGASGPNKGCRRRILQPQTGHLIGGTVNAIIGASGAGKSTLLECLAGRRHAGVGGQVRLHRDPSVFDRPLQVAYLPQTEALIPVLTVRETLMFASKLKNHAKLRTHGDHVQLVNALLDELRLYECADTRVHSVSGGQRKRVAIAAELISGPDVILLDEPTSGLDSCTAYLLVRLLRGLTCLANNQNQFRAPIVACSIHQPSAQLLTLFHGLYVLSSDGRCIYQGSPQHLIGHLSSLGLQCPPYQDPVSFVTEIASGQLGVGPLERLAEAHALSIQNDATLSYKVSTGQTNPSYGFFQNTSLLRSKLKMNPPSGSLALFNGLPFSLHDTVEPPRCESFVELDPTTIEATTGPITITTTTAANQHDSVTDESWDWMPSKDKCKANLFDWPSSTGAPFHAKLSPWTNKPWLTSTLSAHLCSESMNSVVRHMRNQSFPFFWHTWVLIHRTYLGTVREPKLTWLRISQTLFIGLLMSFLYDRPIGQPDGCVPTTNPFASWPTMHADSNSIPATASQHTTHENVAFIFFVTLFLVMSSMMPTVLTFPNEVRVLVDERSNGYYPCGAYYLAKVLADTPFVLFNALLFCCLVYPLTGQMMLWSRFALFVGLANLVALIAHCIGMLFGTIYVHSVTSAVFMAPISMSPVFLLSGFFGKIAALPLLLKPIAYLSYVRYVFECFLIALYGFQRCPTISTDSLTINSTVLSATTSSANDARHMWNGNGMYSNYHDTTNDTAAGQGRSLLAQALPNELLRNLSAYLPPSDSPDLWGKIQESDLWAGMASPPDSSTGLSDLSIQPPFTNITGSSAAMLIKNSTGSLVLDYYNLTDDLFTFNLCILGACFVVLRILAYFILVVKTNRSRN